MSIGRDDHRVPEDTRPPFGAYLAGHRPATDQLLAHGHQRLFVLAQAALAQGLPRARDDRRSESMSPTGPQIQQATERRNSTAVGSRSNRPKPETPIDLPAGRARNSEDLDARQFWDAWGEAAIIAAVLLVLLALAIFALAAVARTNRGLAPAATRSITRVPRPLTPNGIEIETSARRDWNGFAPRGSFGNAPMLAPMSTYKIDVGRVYTASTCLRAG